MQKPTVLPAQPNRDPRPVDVETMRVITARLLGENAELPSLKELDTMCLQLRGHLMLLIPEVSELASQRPRRTNCGLLRRPVSVRRVDA